MRWVLEQLPRFTRDGLLFMSGLVLVIHESLFRDGQERPTLLVLFAAMMGLPVFLRKDETSETKPAVESGDKEIG